MNKAPQSGADARLEKLRKSQAYAAGFAEASRERPERRELVARLGSHPLADSYFAGHTDGRSLMGAVALMDLNNRLVHEFESSSDSGASR